MNERRLYSFAILGSILSLLGCSNSGTNGQSLPPPPIVSQKKRISLDEQWETFRRLGFTLNPAIDKSVIEALRKDKSIEDRPYSILYMELGRTIQKEPWTPLTDRCWDFDVEAIEDHGAYIEIMKNLERISRGELKFDKIDDYVDLEEGIAWVSFSIKGDSHKWNLKVNDDWVDTELFTKIVALTQKIKTKGKYTYFDTGGQNAVIGYETPDHREAIVKSTGLKIEWLN